MQPGKSSQASKLREDAMRVWRKLYGSILESSGISSLSDQAALLLTFLIAAQDDTGYYPWDPTKIKRLTITRAWSADKIQIMAKELCKAGITKFEEGGIILVNGAKLNGKPRKGVAEDRYSRNTPTQSSLQPDDSLTTATQQPVALEKSRVERVEQSRERGGFAAGKMPSTFNELDITTKSRLVEQFSVDGVPLWDERVFRDKIDQALNHKAAKNYTKPYAYLNGWLQRDIDRMKGGSNHGNAKLEGRFPAAVDDPEGRYASIDAGIRAAKRRREEKAASAELPGV